MEVNSVNDNQKNSNDLSLAQAQAVQLASKSDLEKIELNKKQLEHDVQFREKQDERMATAYLQSLQSKENIAKLFFKDRTKRYILYAVLFALIFLFLMYSSYNSQLEYLIPFLGYIGVAMISFFGGFGYGKSRKDKNNKDV